MERLLKHFKNLSKIQIVKPTKYGLRKVVNFNNRSIKSQLEKHKTVLYITYNEGKTLVTERFLEH